MTMGRPRKLDALTPAERARRYRARCAGRHVTETVTECITETPRYRLVVDSPIAPWPRVVTCVSEEDWPFPGSPAWFDRHGYCVARPGAL